jgi:assimilatory nitrate reductase catalytic subunit
MNAHAPAPGIHTTCPYCGVGCGVVATPDGTGGTAIAGDKSHPANGGRLCSKGAALGETLGLETRRLIALPWGCGIPSKDMGRMPSRFTFRANC